jgi:predicted metal-dependent phosphoesterase TrpH
MRPVTVPNADLHCHSVHSDGVLEPAELARRAHGNGVTLWALTDHDEVAGTADAAAAALALGMPFVPGVEISVTWAGRTVHIVGLRVDPANAELAAGLARIREGRAERAAEIGRRLDARLGISGCLEGALRYALNPGLVSRTHFARFLVDQGHCPTIQSVFDRHLGQGKPANVPGRWASLDQAVAWITGAGGRAVIAHPGRYAYSQLEYGALFDAFREAGGEGIEVVTGSHRPAQFDEYAKVARHYGFLASRGSDFHSPGESRVDLGTLPPLPEDLKPVWYDWLE